MSVEIDAIMPKEYNAEISVVTPQGSGAGGGVPRDEFDLLEQKVDGEIKRAKQAEKELGERIDNIKIPEVPEVDLSDYYTKEEVNTELKEKQDAIADLDTIRSGAQRGATAVQSEGLTTAINVEKSRAEAAEKALQDSIDAWKGESFVTLEETDEEVPDVPEYITREDLDNAILEAITNTINTPV